MRLAAALLWIAATGMAAAPAAAPASGGDSRAVLDQYCVSCHNQRLKTAGLLLDQADPAKAAESPELWEKVVRRLRAGDMPPSPARRPDRATYDRVAADLETSLDRAVDGHPYAGRPRVRRLNRSEYANAIRDLLALDVDVASLLPPDDAAFGFDNIADLLGTSPALLERYLNAAGRISALAVGDPAQGPGSETYRVRQDLSQDRHIEGQPLGTVGGTLVRHTFPIDGEYVFQVKLFRTNTDVARGLQYPHELEITLDGERIFLGLVGGDADFRALYEASTEASNAIDARLQVRVPVKAGPRMIGAAFLEKSLALDTRLLRPYVRSSADTYDFTGPPHISTFTVTGPFGAGAGAASARRRAGGRSSSAVPAARPRNSRVPGAFCRASPGARTGGRRARTTWRPCSSSTKPDGARARSRRASSTRCSGCSRARRSSFAWNATRGPLRRVPCTRWAGTSSRRGCRSFSGAACPTRNSSGWPARAG